MEKKSKIIVFIFIIFRVVTLGDGLFPNLEDIVYTSRCSQCHYPHKQYTDLSLLMLILLSLRLLDLDLADYGFVEALEKFERFHSQAPEFVSLSLLVVVET